MKKYRGGGTGGIYNTYASIIKRIDLVQYQPRRVMLVQHMKPNSWTRIDSWWRKKGFWLQRKLCVILKSYLWSWRTNPDISRSAEGRASDSIPPEREPFGFGNALGTFLKYLYSIILCTGRTNYVNIPITCWWEDFHWKLILGINTDLRNIRPAKYKCFTVFF